MNNKRCIEITGQPLYPIAVGQLAWIQEQDGIRRTTSVERVEPISQSEMRFETRNTVYLLRVPANRQEPVYGRCENA